MEKWYEVIRLKNYNSKDDISIHYLQNLDMIKNDESKDYLWKCREIKSLPTFDATATAIECLTECSEIFNTKLHQGKQALKPFDEMQSYYLNYMWPLIFGLDTMIANLQKKASSLNKYNVTFNTDSELQSNIVVLATNEKAATQGLKELLDDKGISYKHESIKIETLNMEQSQNNTQ